MQWQVIPNLGGCHADGVLSKLHACAWWMEAVAKTRREGGGAQGAQPETFNFLP